MAESAPAPPTTQDSRAAAIAYLAGLVTGIFCLWRYAERPFVRFHAWQSILLWVVLGLLILATNIVPIVGEGIAAGLFAVGFGLTVFLVWRAWRGAWTMLPLLGDIALEQAFARR
jgi:uncharacterized membrane protein